MESEDVLEIKIDCSAIRWVGNWIPGAGLEEISRSSREKGRRDGGGILLSGGERENVGGDFCGIFF